MCAAPIHVNLEYPEMCVDTPVETCMLTPWLKNSDAELNQKSLFAGLPERHSDNSNETEILSVRAGGSRDYWSFLPRNCSFISARSTKFRITCWNNRPKPRSRSGCRDKYR